MLENVVQFTKPGHLTRDQAVAPADSQGRNISFGDAQSIVAKAHRWLAANHARHFDRLDAQDLAVLDLTTGIRNQLAHRSQASLDRMNQSLGVGALYPTGLQRTERGIYNIGSYLKAWHGENTRLDIIIERLTGISRKL